MTKQEITIILKLIELRTSEVEVCKGSYSKEMSESDIEDLIKDIIDIFGNENEEAQT